MICDKMSDSLQDEALSKSNGNINGNILQMGNNKNKTNSNSSCSC